MMATFRAWDGKTTDGLRAVAVALTVDDHPTLLAASRDKDEVTARAASWVLKAAYENSVDIPFPADVLAGDPHWEVALHLLQSVQHCPVEMPAEVVTPYLTHARPMLRAWALDAYVRLGGADRAVWLERAMDDPAASVRARARNLLKKQ